MKPKDIYVTTQGSFVIGRQGENLVNRIVFPQRPELMDNAWTLYHRRATDQAGYPVPLEVEGDTLVWTVAAGDTAIAGVGEAVLICTGPNGEILKSQTYGTKVLRSMMVGGEAPEVMEPYLSRLDRDLTHVEKLAESAADLVDSTMELAERTEELAEDTKELAEDTKELAQRTEESLKVAVKTVNGQKPDENGNVNVESHIQSDWAETDPQEKSYIRNKPTEEDTLTAMIDTGLISPVSVDGVKILRTATKILIY